MPPERTLGLVRGMIALAVDAVGFVRAGRACRHHCNRWVGVGTALAAPSAPGTHVPMRAAGLRGMTPPAAAIAEGDAPLHLCGLDKGAHAVYLDGVVGKDVLREATGLAVPDVKVDQAQSGVRRLAQDTRRPCERGVLRHWVLVDHGATFLYQ